MYEENPQTPHTPSKSSAEKINNNNNTAHALDFPTTRRGDLVHTTDSQVFRVEARSSGNELIRHALVVLLAGENEGRGAQVIGQLEGGQAALGAENGAQTSLLAQPGRCLKGAQTAAVLQRWVGPSS